MSSTYGSYTWESVLLLCHQLYSDNMNPYYDSEWLNSILACVCRVFNVNNLDYSLTNVYLEEPLWIMSGKLIISIPAISYLLNKPITRNEKRRELIMLQNFDIFSSAEAVTIRERKRRRNLEDETVVREIMNNLQFYVLLMLVRVVIMVRHLYQHFPNPHCTDFNKIKLVNKEHVTEKFEEPIFAKKNKYAEYSETDDVSNDDDNDDDERSKKRKKNPKRLLYAEVVKNQFVKNHKSKRNNYYKKIEKKINYETTDGESSDDDDFGGKDIYV